MLNIIKKKILQFLPKNHITRGISILVGGTFSAQLLMIIAMPILTRLYTPEDFGLLAIYASLLGILVVIAGLSYDSAIPIPESDKEAAHLTILSLFSVAAWTAITFLLVILFRKNIAIYFGNLNLEIYLWLLPFGVFLGASYYVYHFWAIRSRNFTNIATTQVQQKLVTLIIQLIGFKFGTFSLIFGQTLGQGSGIIKLAKPTFTDPNFKDWKFTDLKKIAIKYKKYPIFVTTEGLANTASGQLPPLLLAIFFSPVIAGFYALSHRVLVLPITLISNAVKNVFLSNAATSYREGTLDQSFSKVIDILSAIMIPMMGIIFIGGPQLFSFVFGDQWIIAGEYSRWMTFWLGMVFIASPLNNLFLVLNKQQEGLYFQLIMLALRTLSLLIGYFFESNLLAIILFSFSSGLCWVFVILRLSFLININFAVLQLNLLKRFLHSILLLLPFTIGSLVNNNIFFWVSLIISLVIIFIYYFYNFRREFYAC
ncbi:oligosaccharide flippase family protein [Ignatzschineria larvae DSM 13226]|uniref:Oligosaccharide flippase family protein n=1 Tax=Ignatzschineria larvae DSM 13226 TaxID=1111732 RepID=A0ABZ3BZW1_9GAMM|nr:oligosaccharide flippase family protein [Ignatzschineria larvae]